jgi:hypothetical protein
MLPPQRVPLVGSRNEFDSMKSLRPQAAGSKERARMFPPSEVRALA